MSIEINPTDVKQLREKTGAGMMDCKRALVESEGNVSVAEEILRKKGIASADKKATRATKEGVIAAAVHQGGTAGVIAEINCETDFVAKNEHFRTFCDLVTRSFAENASVDLEPARIAAVATLGENIRITRHTRYETGATGLVASYIHLQGKVGVLVEVTCGTEAAAKSDGFRDFVKDITLHIAAAHPLVVSRESVATGLLDKEREIYRAQIKDKPANIVEKIVDGKIDKYYSSICLLDQGFIKNPDQTIADLIKSKAGELGEVKVCRFARYLVGEVSSEESAAE